MHWCCLYSVCLILCGVARLNVSLGAGAGDVGVIIVDSQGRRDTVEIILENKGDSVFRCTYVPVLEGPHTIYVTFAGQQIPRSPFSVRISEGESAPHSQIRPPRPPPYEWLFSF